MQVSEFKDYALIVHTMVGYVLNETAPPCPIGAGKTLHCFGNAQNPGLFQLEVCDSGQFKSYWRRGTREESVKYGLVQHYGGDIDMPKGPSLAKIAQALEKYIQDRHPQTALYWVSVVGQPSWESSLRFWAYNDHEITVTVSQGISEGSLIHVNAEGPYGHDSEPLFTIKVLCRKVQAFDEAKVVDNFFSSPEFYQLTGQL